MRENHPFIFGFFIFGYIMLNKNLIKFKGITLNPKTNHIHKNNNSIKLTQSESKILTLLLSSPHRVFSKDEIFHYAWEGTTSSIVVVPQAISVLREKLHYNDIIIIETIKKKGYKADIQDVFFEKKKINKNYLFLFFVALIIFLFSLIYFKINVINTTKKPDVSLNKLMPNVFQTSDSLPFFLTHLF